MSLGRFFKEPLLHFLLAGLVIYFLLSGVEKDEVAEEILVTRDTLKEYAQFRSKAFDEAHAERLLNELTAGELRELLTDYQREEALYREAKKLGLEQGDYIIRQRLIGKMKYLTERSDALKALDEPSLQIHFEENISDYVEPAKATFSHVFLAEEANTESPLQQRANRALSDLINQEILPENSTGYGDRFLFHTHYVDKAYAAVAAELGVVAADAIFAEQVQVGKWFGPLSSKYGLHLVYILKQSPERVPDFSEIRAQVVRDYSSVLSRQLERALEQAIVSNYRMQVSPDLEQWIDSRGMPANE